MQPVSDSGDDPSNNGVREETEFERFERLTKQLVKVPKFAIKNGEPRKTTPVKQKEG